MRYDGVPSQIKYALYKIKSCAYRTSMTPHDKKRISEACDAARVYDIGCIIQSTIEDADPHKTPTAEDVNLQIMHCTYRWCEQTLIAEALCSAAEAFICIDSPTADIRILLAINKIVSDLEGKNPPIDSILQKIRKVKKQLPTDKAPSSHTAAANTLLDHAEKLLLPMKPTKQANPAKPKSQENDSHAPEIMIRITELESILTNSPQDHTQEELDEMEEELRQLNYLQEIWDRLQTISIDRKFRRICVPFTINYRNTNRIHKTFPVGTKLDDIYEWLENTFCIDVAHDLAEGPIR